jgi:hypothetical protein
MTISPEFETALNTAKAWFDAQPAEMQSAEFGMARAALDALTPAAETAVDAAKALLPPVLSPFAGPLASLIDNEISKAQQEADSKIGQLQAAKALLD